MMVSRSSGSRRYKAMWRQGRYSRRFPNQMMKRRRQSFETSALLEVGTPNRVKGIRIRFDFQMAPNPDIRSRGQPMPDYFPVRGAFAIIDCKGPHASPDVMPVLTDDPLGRLTAVPASRPSPQTTPDQMINFAEHAFRRNMPMITNPTPNDRVELPNQVILAGAVMVPHHLSNLRQERLCVLLRRCDQQLAAAFAKILSKEVEPLIDMCDRRLLRREPKPPFREKIGDHGIDFVLQLLSRASGDDEVIRVSDEVDFGMVVAAVLESLTQQSLQSLQGQVHQRRRDHSPYTLGNFEFTVRLPLVRRPFIRY